MSSRTDRGRQDLLDWEAARPKNFYTSDPALQLTMETRLGRERHQAERAALTQVGELSANELGKLARETNLDENLPRLERFNGLGVRTEEIVFHPSYHAMGRLIWSTGVLARYREPGSETLQAGLNYLLGMHGELGHMCPLACTAGLIKVLMGAG